MSEPLQFVHHPDADQISAFVEHALPAHEREQMLDHLAVCPECRAVVALSLPEVEEPRQSQPAVARKTWWSGWTLAWPVAAALTASALFVVYIRHAPIAPVAREQQVAVADSAVPPALHEQPIAPAAGKESPRRSQAPPASSLGVVAGVVVAAPKSEREAPLPAQSIGGPILMGRNAVPARPPAAPPPAPVARDAIASPGPDLNRVPAVIAMAPANAAEARPEPAASIHAAAPGPPLDGQAAKASVQTAAASTAVTSAPIKSANSDLSGIEIAQAPTKVPQLQRPLPSNLPVLSMAAQAQRIVAIDTGHAVFVSKDGGKHWKGIQAPWPGRAVKASLVEFPAGSVKSLTLRKSATAGQSRENDRPLAQNTSGALAAQTASSLTANGPRLSGAVTDMTGAAIPGASVTVTESATGTSRTVRSDNAGRYVVDGLAAGTYGLEAQAPGFQKKELEAVAVPSAGQGIQNLSLAVGTPTQTVTVQAESVEMDSSATANAKFAASSQRTPVFEIITDNGERWTSADGVIWKHM